MTELNVSALLAVIYDIERTRSFWRLRREMEQYYRLGQSVSYKRDAYIDSMLAMLLEHEGETAIKPLYARNHH